jgi:hypothetical protein
MTDINAKKRELHEHVLLFRDLLPYGGLKLVSKRAQLDYQTVVNAFGGLPTTIDTLEKIIVAIAPIVQEYVDRIEKAKEQVRNALLALTKKD